MKPIMREQLTQQQRHPNWEKLYQSKPKTSLPWYMSQLDPEFEQILHENKFGTHVLDIGTGTGELAELLCKKGYSVTGIDLSQTAIDIARKSHSSSITFSVGNILHIENDAAFDLLIDRGCFHVLDEISHSQYVSNAYRLLKPKGNLLLKCFTNSIEDPGFGPLRMEPLYIQNLFRPHFYIESIKRGSFTDPNGNSQESLLFQLQRRN